MKPQVSVVVCTFNRYDLLSEAVASIKLQSLAQDAYELIIVDNSDEPATREQLPAGLETVCNYRYITEARPGLSRARNIGIKAAAGGIVAFMDDDAKASPRWLARIIETFGESEGTGIVGGPVRPIWTGPRPSWLHPWLEGYLTILDRGTAVRVLRADEWLAGTNIAFRKNALEEAGLFPENMGRIGRLLLSNEELVISDKIRQLGYEVVYDPEIVVLHRVHAERASQAWLRRRVFWQAISDLFAERASTEAEADPDREIGRVLDFLMQLAPKNRGTMGLFRDLEDPELFRAQTEAISALVRLLAGHAGDWRCILGAAGS